MLTELTRRRVVGYAVVATAGIAIGAGGLAFAASSNTVLHACAMKGTGTLRLAARCTRRERAVTWNVQGPQGPRGAKGDTGAVGLPGSTGAPGAPGSPAASVMTARTNVTIGQEGYFAASGPSAMSTTESDVIVLTPDTTMTAQNFAVKDLVSSPDDDTRVYVLRVNGSDTALTCSIVSGSHTCTDSTHTVEIPPDSQVTIHRAIVQGTGGGVDGTAVLAAWRATTP